MTEQKTSTKIKFLSFVSNVFTIITGLMTLIPLGFGILTKQYNYFYLSMLLFIISVTIFIYRNKISKKGLSLFMNFTAPNKVYKLINKTVTYEFLARDKMRHEKTFKIKVLHDGFNHMLDKYTWTGKQELVAEPIIQNQKVEPVDRKFGMQRVRISYKDYKIFSKNEKVEMGFKIENMEDKEKNSSLHLSSGIYEITDFLILKVIFNKDLSPKNIRKLEYIHYTDDEHYKCEKLSNATLDESQNKKIIEWQIKKPIYGGKYIIDWEFAE